MTGPLLPLAQVRANLQLRADCSRCAGLCCVAPGFANSADFAIDKAPGAPCPHLTHGFRCAIHAELRTRGFPGCAAFDCLGAGQKVTRTTFGGVDWRVGDAEAMFAAFGAMRQLHELAWYLTEAIDRSPTPDLQRCLDEVLTLSSGDAAALRSLDVGALRDRINAQLTAASERIRSSFGRTPQDYRGADLAGAKLTAADLTGADLRGAGIAGANLRDALFLTQSQLDSARGDATTAVPPWLTGYPE